MLNSNFRRMMMATITTQTDGYTLLDYIESTGQQYIDTRATGPNAEYEIKFLISPKIPRAFEQFIAGDINPNDTSATPKIFWFDSKNKAVMQGVFAKNDAWRGAFYVDGLRLNEIVTVSTRDGQITVNGTTVNTQPSPVSFGQLSPWVFGSQAEPELMSAMRLYNLKMWSNGVLIRDFRPCFRVADNKTGLLDMVERKFYQNEGSGEFLRGDIL